MRRMTYGGALLLALTLLLPNMALAGRATINDKADILTSQDEQGITGYAAQVSFDVHVITQKGTGDRAMDDATLQRSMNGSIRSNAVVVGISIGPNIANVKYGTGTNIPPGDANSVDIVKSAVPMLRAQRWGEAVGQMLRRSRGLQISQAPPWQQYRPETPPESLYANRPPPDPYQHSSPPSYDPPMKPVETSDGHPVLWTLFILLVLCGGAWFFFRRKDDGNSMSSSWNPLPGGSEPPRPTHSSSGPSYPQRTYPAVPRREHSMPRPITPAYSSAAGPVIIHERAGGGDLATGILLGSALSHREPERIIEREVIRESPHYEPPAPSYTSSVSFDEPSRSVDFDPPSSSPSWDAPSLSPSSDSTPSVSFDSPASSTSVDF